MLNIEANVPKNVLYVTISGHMKPSEIADGIEATRKAVAQLKPGFSVINDIRKCHATDQAGLEALHRVMAYMSTHGMQRVVRVTQIALSAIQFDRISQQVGVQFINTFSLEEAEKILATRPLEFPEAGKGVGFGVKARQYRRVAVGPEHTVRFTMGGRDFEGIRITNLSAQGCFMVIQNRWGDLFHEGAILTEFGLEHSDLPSTRISAKIVRMTRNLTEISEDDLGMGILFLCQSPPFLEWIDAFVSAFFDHEG